MPSSPGIDIRLFDLTVYSPQISSAIVGCVGPATKGPINTLTTFTDEGNFVLQHGRPIDRQFAPRALIRYLKRGNQGKFVRVAGRNLQTATLTLYDSTGRIPVLNLSAASPGSWANTDLQVSVTYNGSQLAPSSYNILVYFLGQLSEQFLVMSNGIVVSRINSGSTRMTCQLAMGAGATFPGQTLNSVTQAITRLSFAGGDDGAFAKSDSVISSTGPFAGARFHGKDDAIAGSRVFENLLTIDATMAGKSIFYGSLGMPVVPGTFTIRVQTAAGPTYIELADSGQLGSTIAIGGMGQLAPAAGTHTGYIDYRTGDYGIKLNVSTLFLTGTIDAIFVRGNTESVGSTARGNATYAGNISQFPMGVGFFNENRAMLTFSIEETVNNGTIVGASINSTGATMKGLAGWIVPGSLVLTPVDATNPVPNPVYDDGFGGFRTQPRGGGLALTGAVDYRTGAFNVTWDATQPTPTITSATTTVQANYDIVVTDMGGGAVPGPTGVAQVLQTVQPSAPAGATVASTDPGAQQLQVPILPGTVRFNISATAGGAFACWDDGFGNLLTSPRGTPTQTTVTGSVNYMTGAWTITPPAPYTPVTVAAIIRATWVQTAEDRARRTMRGTGPQALGAGGFNAAGVVYDDPASTNASPFNGSTFLDHATGLWGAKFTLVAAIPSVNTMTFDFKDKAAITAVYVPANILGFGDGTTTLYDGTLASSPYRRQANRLRAFKGSAASAAGAGEPSETYATLGATDAADFWSENVVAIPDPSNFLNYRTGLTSFEWSGAPLSEEATFIIADDTVLNVDAKWPGDIGNERTSLTSGFYCSLGSDPTLAGTLLFTVSFNNVVQESFGQATDLPSLVAIVNDPTNGSALVSLRLTAEGNFLPADVSASQNVGLNGAFTLADLIGAKVGQTYTGLQMFSNAEVVPVNWLMLPGAWHRQAITALQQMCEKRGRRAIGIIPSPDLNDPFAHAAFFDGAYNAASPGGPAVPTVLVPYPPLAAIDSSQLATVVPFVSYFDQYTNAEVFEPADGEMANLVAGTPAPWFPIAGLRRGQVNVDTLRYSASQDDRDLIYGVVGTTTEIVNTIIRKEGRGLLLYGQRTAQRHPSSLDRINVRWTVNVIMNLLDLISQEFVFEINDPILWREVAQALNKVLSPIIERRGLEDAFVVVDSTTTTAEMIDNLQMGAKLFIKPARAAEFLIYDLILTPSGANFADIKVAG